MSAPQLGKTTVLQIWLLACGWMHGADRRPWWWAAPIYDQARHGFRGFCDLARSAGVLKECTTTPPLTALLINGARYEARSWDRPEGMYGPSILGAGIDEFGMLTDTAYSALSSRRAETIQQGFGRFRYAGNVGEMGGPAEKLWRMAEDGAPGFACRRWTWRDRALAEPCSCDEGAEIPVGLETAGSHVPECRRGIYLGFIAREKARMTPTRFRSLYDAEWVDWNEAPVYCFDREKHVRKTEIQPSLPLELSCDFNVDPMAWVVGQGKGEDLWAHDAIAIEGGTDTDQACTEFLRRYGRGGTGSGADAPMQSHRMDLVVYGDASGRARKTSAAQTDYDIIASRLTPAFRSIRFAVPGVNPAVVDRVNAFNEALRLGHYWANPQAKPLIEDLVRTSWKPGTRDIDKTTDKRRTHWSDADGYRVASRAPYRSTAVFQPPPPAPFRGPNMAARMF